MSSCGPRVTMTSTRCSRSTFTISGSGVDASGSYGIEAPQLADLRQRRKNMQKHRLPHLVADRAGTVVGYAYAVPFRKRPAYRYAVKHSIYVHHEHLHSGIGRLLLPALIDACAASGYRQMIGYIDASNHPSIHLHEAFGFRQVGYLPSIGFKFGRWTDSMIMQRPLGPGATTAPDMRPYLRPGGWRIGPLAPA